MSEPLPTQSGRGASMISTDIRQAAAGDRSIASVGLSNKSVILVSWIGKRDLDASRSPDGDGPVFATVRHLQPTQVYLLFNYPEPEVAPYLDWLRNRVAVPIAARHAQLRTPVDYADIHCAADALLAAVWRTHPNASRHILLSPGTPAMQAVWILLGKTRYPALFVQASEERGVEAVELPFTLSAEFLPVDSAPPGQRLREMMAAEVPAGADFDRIVTAHPRLLALKQRAAVLARFPDVPVLLLGETGTGKELFARAIHNSSPRAKLPFFALNCGAISIELIDSTLFGHVKGAFTGALRDHLGAFAAADGGTLFLDELGELPLAAQVRLLRVMQEGELTPVGASKTRRVDVRLIGATHRDLQAAVAAHRFREDLYYRVAVGVLELPPLRERQGDLHLLTEHFLREIRARLVLDSPLMATPHALNRLLRHHWPGNVRELHATLLRAALWTRDGRLTADDIDEGLLLRPAGSGDVLNRPLGEGFALDALLAEVEAHYLRRALAAAGGNKTRASRLLGFGSHQVLSNRLRSRGISADAPGSEGDA